MPIVDDITSILNDGSRSESQKRKDIYALKITSLVDVINNGKPAPNPIPPLIGREFMLDGKTVTVHRAKSTVQNGAEVLFIDLTLNGNWHQLSITNPPVLPRVTTGDEKRDLIQAASEMLASLDI